MKLRSKISFTILPLICLFFLAFAQWSTNKAGERLRESEYTNLETVLGFFVQEQLELANVLLQKNNLTIVPSFVAAYQKTAIESISGHYTVKNGQLLILNNQGKIIYGQGPYADQDVVNKSYKPLQEALVSKRVPLSRGHIERGEIHDIFVATNFVPWGWTVFSTKRDTEIHKTLRSITLAGIGVATACALTCYLLIAFFFDKFLSRPINLLTDAAQDIGLRKGIVSIPVMTNDQLGVLARSMETMSTDIAEYQKKQLSWQEKLELEVKAQTEDLKKELIVRLKTQEALQKSEELLNEVGAIALIGGWEIDLTSGETVWTRQTYAIWDKNNLDPPVNCSQFTSLFCSPYREEIAASFENLKENDVVYNIEAELSGDGDRGKWCRLVFRGVRVKNSTAKIRGTIQDVTAWKNMQQEQNRLQSKLLQAQKLEAIGQLASGIAHEINTPTQFISSNIDFLKGSFGDIEVIINNLLALPSNNESSTDLCAQVRSLQNKIEETDWEFLSTEIPTAIQQSQDGLKRVATIVQAMKTFSHPGTKEKSETSLNLIINNTITITRNEWKYVAEMDLSLAAELPTLYCYSDEVSQAVLNLIVNAAHAIEEKFGDTPDCKKGIISISTAFDSQWITLRIGDNGVGIPQDAENKIFNPFFTTKEVGKGSGQGLAIVYDVIVNKHDGEIDVETQSLCGTTFTIRLPAEKMSSKTAT